MLKRYRDYILKFNSEPNMQTSCFETNSLKSSKNPSPSPLIGLKIVGINDDNDEVSV